MHTDTTPSMIGHRYVLQTLLGSGGMGSVYRAVDRLTGQVIALKRVTTDLDNLQFSSRDDGGDFKAALTREFAALASLKHPNIISVLDYGFDDLRQPFFTMELLEGAE